ncbi:MAG TPA: hypothetical protein VJC16_05655 [Candidatus Nanoarchaeia archaeon]|nr:hypothetical protein [Candidatus Nanoarchaeia archaeon]
MEFEDFFKEGKVRKASVDKELARSLIKTAESDLVFLKNAEINGNSARKVFTGFYDVLRSVIEALAILDGYKVYSHEAFTYYLKEKNENNASIQFDRLRKIRNRINYYGKDISVEEVKESIPEIIELIDMLKGRKEEWDSK